MSLRASLKKESMWSIIIPVTSFKWAPRGGRRFEIVLPSITDSELLGLYCYKKCIGLRQKIVACQTLL